MRGLARLLLSATLLILASCELSTAPSEFARGELEGQPWVAAANLQADQLCFAIRYPMDGRDAIGPSIGGCSTPASGIGVAGFDEPTASSFVYGATPAEAVEVVVELADGRVFRGPTWPSPASVTDDVRLFVVPIEGPADVARYEAVAADGTIVDSHQH